MGYEDFGKKLSFLLKDKGLSQRELAKSIGVTETTISRYASGGRVPRGSEIKKIADVLGVSIDFLLSNDHKYMSVNELLVKLNILANDITLPINECVEYHRTKIVIEKVLNI